MRSLIFPKHEKPGFFLCFTHNCREKYKNPVSGGDEKKKETGFLRQQWWGDRDFFKKPGFWLFFGDMADRSLSPRQRNRVSMTIVVGRQRFTQETRFLAVLW
jgi:hypothetical protein